MVTVKSPCGDSKDYTFTQDAPADWETPVICPIPAPGAYCDSGAKDKNCNTSGSYTFSVTSGSSYASLSNTNPSTGKFRITFTENKTTSTRSATVRVTSPCGTTKDITFTQDAALDPLTIAAGTGVLSGRTCFDIAKYNDSQNGCGAISSRITQQADFTKSATNTQTYTFTPSGTISKVRFAYVEKGGGAGIIVQSLTPSDPGYATRTSITGACTAILVYKSSLNTDAEWKTSANQLEVDIYAIYNDNSAGTGTDRAVKLTAAIKDCVCCGAYLGANQTKWTEFRCYNLGVSNTSLDPLVPAKGLHGSFYKFGSSTEAVSASTNESNNDAISNWNLLPYQNNTDAWDTNNDPCRSLSGSWRLPTRAEWENVIAYNSYSKVGTWYETNNLNAWAAGIKLGPLLMLPTTGWRNYTDGRAWWRGNTLLYWGSNPDPNGGTAIRNEWNATVFVTANMRDRAIPIRCISK